MATWYGRKAASYRAAQNKYLQKTQSIHREISALLGVNVNIFGIQSIPSYKAQEFGNAWMNYLYVPVASIHCVYDHISFWAHVLFSALAQSIYLKNETGVMSFFARAYKDVSERVKRFWHVENTLDFKQSRMLDALKALWNNIWHCIFFVMHIGMHAFGLCVNEFFRLVVNIFNAMLDLKSMVSHLSFSNLKYLMSLDVIVNQWMPSVALCCMYMYAPHLMANAEGLAGLLIISMWARALVSMQYQNFQDFMKDIGFSFFGMAVYASLFEGVGKRGSFLFACIGAMACVDDRKNLVKLSMSDVLVAVFTVTFMPWLPSSTTMILISCSPYLHHRAQDIAFHVRVMCLSGKDLLLVTVKQFTVEVLYKTLFDIFNTTIKFPFEYLSESAGLDAECSVNFSKSGVKMSISGMHLSQGDVTSVDLTCEDYDVYVRTRSNINGAYDQTNAVSDLLSNAAARYW